ncbi:DsrE family protein [Cecembia sp.]|uniref:DsrE family protein n=1 Tax=Cecembia sp. TaxID=1898110 RepID=UPI0025BA2EC4|nr:DsrE family protein [Cecembia sp.]
MMIYKIFLFFISFFISYQLQAQVVSTKNHKIIFQLTTADSLTHRKFIRQLENILKAAPNAQIEVITHGMGVDLLKENSNPFFSELLALQDDGIRFTVCENTLKQRKLKKEAFYEWSGFVQSGILELVIKQEQGWIYIKAGE